MAGAKGTGHESTLAESQTGLAGLCIQSSFLLSEGLLSVLGLFCSGRDSRIQDGGQIRSCGEGAAGVDESALGDAVGSDEAVEIIRIVSGVHYGDGAKIRQQILDHAVGIGVLE